jgi:hypothetical protein
LVVSQHAPFSHLAKHLHLSSESLVFVDLLHKTSVLLRFSWIDSLRPATLSVVHALLTSTHTFSIDLVNGKLGNVVQFNKVWIAQDVVFILEAVLGSWVEGSTDWTGVRKSWRTTELPTSASVLVELSH